jgi:hypothetical protein
MSSEFLPSEEPRGSAGAAPERDPARAHGKRPRSWRRIMMTGVTVAAVVGGAGLAVAASSSGTPANAATATASQVQSHSAVDPGWGHGMAIVHGQAVIAKSGGGYQTVDYQRGTVTAVSTTSITLKSSDGFTMSYAINGSTIVGANRGGIGSVKAGNTASVIATVSGKTATAAKVIDWTQLEHSHMLFGSGP